MSGSIRFPTYLPTVSDRGGRQQRGGEQREVAQRRGRTTEEAGKIHLFIPALSVKSPVQFLFLCLLLSCFLLLYPARLSLCPSLTQTPIILLLLPHTRSLILNLFFPLYQPFFNCSPCTSLLPTSSLFSFLSIASEHATSQHNPFTHSR